MSTPKPDPARGWLYVEKLLAEEDIDEIDRLDEEATAAALRARGRDPEKLTSVDELLARAQTAASRPARSPASAADEPARSPAPIPISSRRKTSGLLVALLVAAALAVAALLAVVAHQAFVIHQAVPRSFPE